MGRAVYAVVAQGSFPTFDQVTPHLISLLPGNRLAVGMEREGHDFSRFNVAKPAQDALPEKVGIGANLDGHGYRMATDEGTTRLLCAQNVLQTYAHKPLIFFVINDLLVGKWRRGWA
jgi:hypothetical protein